MVGYFPPKQVLAVVTGWDRQSFTAMEAQRVLTTVGSLCRRAGSMAAGAAASVQPTPAQIRGPSMAVSPLPVNGPRGDVPGEDRLRDVERRQSAVPVAARTATKQATHHHIEA
jgi:hypothetical protein